MITKLLLAALLSCDPALAALFTPAHPQLGTYQVCTTPQPLAEVAPAGWTIEALEPLDAFGTAGPYRRSALARLYGGRRPMVARGWTSDGERFESVTMISPYPDRSLTRLEPGTLVVRWECRTQNDECRMMNAKKR
jgi:hypothetical protein